MSDPVYPMKVTVSNEVIVACFKAKESEIDSLRETVKRLEHTSRVDAQLIALLTRRLEAAEGMLATESEERIRLRDLCASLSGATNGNGRE